MATDRPAENERPLIFPLPAKLALDFVDRQIVDAREAEFHVAEFVELPVLVAVSTIPLAGVVVVLILKTHRDAIAAECPQRFLQAIIQFTIPFSAEEFDDLARPCRNSVRLRHSVSCV